MQTALLVLALLSSALLANAAKVKAAVRRSRRLSKGFMLRAFVTTLFDPTFKGHIKVKRPRRRKGKKAGEISNFALGSGATFGPICGPNGCH